MMFRVGSKKSSLPNQFGIFHGYFKVCDVAKLILIKENKYILWSLHSQHFSDITGCAVVLI